MRKSILCLSLAVLVAPLLATDVARAAGSEYLVESFSSAPTVWTEDWFDGTVGSRNRISQVSAGVSGKAINVSVPAGSHFGSAAHYRFGDQGLSDPDELYYRYFIRLPESFKNYGSGKIPGPAGLYSASGRNGIKPSNSNPGWSARMQFAPSTTPATANTTAIGFYVYHRNQAKATGDTLMWDPSVGVLKHGAWTCVEGHVSMNTPGVRNGVLEGWVDEKLAFYQDDFQFLGSADAALGIKSFWFDTYYGGDGTAPGSLNFQFDELVLSPDRVGCGEVAEPRFSDTGGNVHAANIDRLAYAGITYGCNPPTNDRFCPDAPVSRGAMAAFLTRALELPAPDIVDRFADDDDSVFEDSIDRLAASGVTFGCNPPTNDRFCPDRAVTRGQMAAFLTRAITFPPPTVKDRFVDDNGSVFEAAIDWLASSGVTVGCNPPSNDRYCPDAPVSRAQMATFLTRALSLPAPPVPPVDPPYVPVVPGGYDAAVPAGWSIQAVINSQPEGADIFVEPGVYQYQSIIPKRNQSVVGAPGAILDGMGLLKLGVSGTAPGASIRGIEVRNFSRGFAVTATGWTIDGAYVHDNVYGVEATGNDLTVTNSRFANHDLEAVKVTGATNFALLGSTFEPSSRSAVRLAGTVGAIVDGNTITGSTGYGVWFTDAASQTTVTNNVISDSAGPGIAHDRAYGSTISGNTLIGNGTAATSAWWDGAGIVVFGPDAHVSANTVTGNHAGIVLFTHSSGLDGPFGPYTPRSVLVEDNVVIESGYVGSNASAAQALNSVFQGNSYTYGADALRWVWVGIGRNWAGWQANGQDTTGSFTTP